MNTDWNENEKFTLLNATNVPKRLLLRMNNFDDDACDTVIKA